jgi:radical SAM protein with 4Fe4S-binding SPASM domain
MDTGERQLTTFIKLNGSADQRIQQATGLEDMGQLVDAMDAKSTMQSVDLLFPSTCNEACGHCFFKEGSGFMKVREKDVAAARRIAGNLAENVDLTIYPREITMATDLLLLLEELNMNRVLSNAVKLSDPAVVQKLWDSGIRKLSVSVHGNKEEQTRLTGSPESFYDRTIEGIRNAVAIGMEVSTFTSVYRGNLENMRETFDMLYELGIKKSELLILLPAGDALEMVEDEYLDKADVKRLLFIVDEARRALTGMKIEMGLSWGPNFYSSGAFRYLAGQSGVWPNSKYFCPAVDRSYKGVSMKTGKVYSCFKMMEPEEEIGIIREDQIVILEEPFDPKRIIEELPNMCRSCEFVETCLGGCMVTNRGDMKICLTNVIGEMIQDGEVIIKKE